MLLPGKDLGNRPEEEPENKNRVNTDESIDAFEHKEGI